MKSQLGTTLNRQLTIVVSDLYINDRMIVLVCLGVSVHDALGAHSDDLRDTYSDRRSG